MVEVAEPKYSSILWQHCLLLPPSELPRTVKGTIRRKQAESLFADQLDQLEADALRRAPPAAQQFVPGEDVSAEDFLEELLQTVHHLAASQEATVDTPLMDAGIDSLLATELATHVSNLVGRTISATIVFEHPTTRAVAEYVGFVPSSTSANEAGPPPMRRDAEHEDVMMVGSSALLPGGAAGSCCSIPELLCTAFTGHDAIQQVPVGRWHLQPVLANAERHGGFVLGANVFDNLAFGISASEASVMDPQQRMLLERGYIALHEAKLVRATLAGSVTARAESVRTRRPLTALTVCVCAWHVRVCGCLGVTRECTWV
jgi:hypothetical protein